VETGKHQKNANTLLERTVTEMVFAPDQLTDGLYLLNLQIPPFQSDAAPSRPVLMPLELIE
jgi:hypothetical protein